jgi:hypothetical protein
MTDQATPAQVRLTDGLGPLPATEWLLHMPAAQYEPEWTSSQEGYEASQMLDYAASEVAKERKRLHDLLRRVADEPNIDKARAIADAELYGPNVELSGHQRPAQE